VILAEELEHVLRPPDGWDLLAELDKACARADGIDGECATEAERLSPQAARISGVFVELGLLPIQNIPQLKSCWRSTLSCSACKKCRPPVLVHGTEFWDGRHALNFRSSSPSFFHFLLFLFCPSEWP
jgi:hypothetical protein